VTDLPAKTPKQKPKRISKAVKDSIRYMALHRTNITDTAQRFGITRETLSRNLSLPHVQDYRDEVVREVLGNAALTAVGQLGHLSTQARSEYVQLNASAEVLNRAGFSDQPQQQGPTTAIQINIDLG